MESGEAFTINSLYRSPTIVRGIKFRRLKWIGYLARMEEGRSALNILTSTPAGKRLFCA